MQIVKCNNCGWIGFEHNLISHPEQGLWCPKCDKEDSCLMDIDMYSSLDRQDADILWELLGDIPIDDDNRIMEEFLDFEVGTDRFEIWSWFEEKFKLSVAIDLMHLEDGF